MSNLKHVAIIMDGNGRWAQNKGLSRAEGHIAGTQNIRRVVRQLIVENVQYVSLYAFSTENWDRPVAEVDSLLQILSDSIANETAEMHEEGVRIRHLGRIDRLPNRLQKAIENSVNLTRKNTVINLNVAFDYGGRDEIVQAVRRLVESEVKPDQITEETLTEHLYTGGMPDPDLIIRTAGEMRISNFMIWQASYSEYYSSPACWPDFDEIELKNALAEYSRRKRKFGALNKAVT
ncbi:MAG: polyprenyl diphosphate synthase [SAR202 cluster bacterium]|nr:polyprenyl diphosphate synthase [SAR202 cluster bacterium]